MKISVDKVLIRSTLAQPVRRDKQAIHVVFTRLALPRRKQGEVHRGTLWLLSERNNRRGSERVYALRWVVSYTLPTNLL